MTTNANNSPDLAALERKLTVLHSELQQSLGKAQRRAKRVLVLALVLLLVVCGYWGYTYRKISRIDADVVADWAYFRALQLAVESRPAAAQALKDRAPEVFDYLEAQGLAAPTVVANRLRDVVLEKTELVVIQSEPVITKVVTDAITSAKTSTTEAGFDGKDPAQMEMMIDKLVAQLHADVREGIDKLYMVYNEKAHEVVDYIDRLAIGKGLDEREQHLRRVIIAFLAIDEKQKLGR